MERIICKAIAKHHHPVNSPLGTQLHGFTSGRSGLSNLLSFLDELTARLDRKLMEDSCLDFQMFDSINHGHLAKLRSPNLAMPISESIGAYLRHGGFWIRVERSISQAFAHSGSAAGLLLFIIQRQSSAPRASCSQKTSKLSEIRRM